MADITYYPMNTSTSKSDCVLISNGWNCEVIFRRAYRGTGEPVLAIITGTKESPNQEGIISAIKDRDQVERFKAIKGIQDQLPHAAKILEIIDNIVITEKVHGKLLWEIEDKVDLPSEESLESELLSIVGELKNSNLVHGDIRPWNLFYNSETKDLKLIDWGFSFFIGKRLFGNTQNHLNERGHSGRPHADIDSIDAQRTLRVFKREISPEKAWDHKEKSWSWRPNWASPYETNG